MENNENEVLSGRNVLLSFWKCWLMFTYLEEVWMDDRLSFVLLILL